MPNQFSNQPYFRSGYAGFPSAVCDGICIPLTKGHHAIIDVVDYKLVSGHHWQYWAGYAFTNITINGKRSRKSMHLVIFGKVDGGQVDHINHDGTNNKRQNLRAATHSQNHMNNKISRNKKVPSKGVSITSGNKYQATIRLAGKLKYLGIYATEVEAARAYDLAAFENFGQFAHTNKPIEAYHG